MPPIVVQDYEYEWKKLYILILQPTLIIPNPLFCSDVLGKSIEGVSTSNHSVQSNTKFLVGRTCGVSQFEWIKCDEYFCFSISWKERYGVSASFISRLSETSREKVQGPPPIKPRSLLCILVRCLYLGLLVWHCTGSSKICGTLTSQHTLPHKSRHSETTYPHCLKQQSLRKSNKF